MILDKRERQLRQQAKIRREQIQTRALYRSGMRQIMSNERSMQGVIDENRRKAIGSEMAGDHGRALSYAKRAKDLENHLNTSSTARNTLEAAYAMSENAAALEQMLGSTGSLMQSMTAAPDMSSLCTAQANVDYLREQLDANSDYCNDFLEMTYPEKDCIKDPDAEAELARIMATQGEQLQQMHILDMTNERLNGRRRANTGR